MIDDLLYSVIDVNIITDFQRGFFICLRKCSVLINDVVHSAVFMFESTVFVVVVLVVLKLIVLICSLVIVHSRLLRIVRSVFFFTLLIVELVRLILIKLTIQI